MSLTGFNRRRRKTAVARAASAVSQAPQQPRGPKPLDRMNKAELQARAAELGLTVSDELTKAQIHEAIEAGLTRQATDAKAAEAAAQAASQAQAQKTEDQSAPTQP